MQSLPKARKDGLVVEALGDELLVYDLEHDKAHCLNRTSALVWKYCDGHKTVRQIAGRLAKDLDAQIDERIVSLGIDQLGTRHLLIEHSQPLPIATGMTRRRMVRNLGIAAAVAVPLVTSIVAPTAAQAGSCRPSNAACTVSSQCCSNICTGGACV